MTMNALAFCSPMSCIVQMLGWFSAEAALASRRNRSNAWLSLDRSSGKNFKATYRSNRVSWDL